jgi:polyphenol oxidase
MSKVPHVEAPALNLPGVRHGFFGRAGGVSEGIYASLNAGPGSKDEIAAVGENRRRIASEMGVTSERLLSVYQVHSARAVRVRGPWTSERPEADAMVTTEKNLPLCILAADCAPVLLADAEAGVIGAAHAGWQGALGGVLESVVAEMQAAGAQRRRIVAAIGPCIGPASYEVGPEYLARFLASDPENAEFFSPGKGDRSLFDLTSYCASRLARAGLTAIGLMERDTCALEADYFSNRRAVKRAEGDYGRNASVIMLSM